MRGSLNSLTPSGRAGKPIHSVSVLGLASAVAAVSAGAVVALDGADQGDEGFDVAADGVDGFALP